MIIGINTLTIEPGRGGGNEHYLRNVLETIRAVQPKADFVVFTTELNHDSFEPWERVQVAGRTAAFGKFESRLERAVKRSDVDVLFTPLNAALQKSPVPQVPFALELMGFEREYRDLSPFDTSPLKTAKRICRDARAIVVPSGYLQRRLLELLEVPLDKIVLAPLGVSEAFGEPQPAVVEAEYVLTVGNVHRFKNMSGLRDALGRFSGKVPASLVVAGQPCEAEPEDWGDSVIRVHRCPTSHLAALYQHCTICVCPSLYEGSAVTVLEAMRAGAPVAASRVGGIPEACKDVPVYFDPQSLNGMMSSIRRLLDEDEESRERRVRSGKQIAAEFTWEQCAWKTLSAFRKM